MVFVVSWVLWESALVNRSNKLSSPLEDAANRQTSLKIKLVGIGA